MQPDDFMLDSFTSGNIVTWHF